MTVVQCWHISHCGDQKTMAGQGTAACPARVDRLERKVASAKAVYLHMDSQTEFYQHLKVYSMGCENLLSLGARCQILLEVQQARALQHLPNLFGISSWKILLL